jgi:hypothetical protein
MKTRYFFYIGLFALLAYLGFRLFGEKLGIKKVSKFTKNLKFPTLMKYSTKMNTPKMIFKIDSNLNLFDAIVRYVKLKEGGLSKDVKDSASKNPVPDGSGYHTNKGITWTSFSENASKLGYDGSIENFYKMPENIWIKIFTKGYLKPFENYTNSKVCNYYLGIWAWGSGVGGAKALLDFIGGKDFLNDFLAKNGEYETLAFLVDTRIEFFKRLVERKPSNEKFLNGWINSALNFWYHFNKYTEK